MSWLLTMSKHLPATQLTFTYSKSTMEISESKISSKLLDTQLVLTGSIFILRRLEQCLKSVQIGFDQLNADWVGNYVSKILTLYITKPLFKFYNLYADVSKRP